MDKSSFLFLYIVDFFHTEGTNDSVSATSDQNFRNEVKYNDQSMEVDFKYKSITLTITMNRKGNTAIVFLKNSQIGLRKRFYVDLIRDIVEEAGIFNLKHKKNFDSFLNGLMKKISNAEYHLSGAATVPTTSSTEILSDHRQKLMKDPNYVAIYEDLKRPPSKCLNN